MVTLLIIIHVFVSVALIMIVLLQTGKGADIGAVFGGGSSQTIFGGRGPTTFLGRLTTVAAIVFMLTSLTLTYIASRRSTTTTIKEPPRQEQTPVPQTPQR